MAVKKFDLIVIGAGSGLNVAAAAAARGMKTAIVEEGPMGGTCLNRGCIPSKIVLHSADVAETIRDSSAFGIRSALRSVDFARIVKRASSLVDKDAREIEEGVRVTKNVTLYKTRATFVGKRTIQAGNDMIAGNKVVIAAGTRPAVPGIEGLDEVLYITSDEALRLKKKPKSMIILGGGFVAMEMAHFFGSLGTKVTILQRSVLLRGEDKEIAEAFTRVFSRKHKIILGYSPDKVAQKHGKIIIGAKSTGGKRIKITADLLLIATGRVPNTDVLDVKRAGVETDGRGFVKTNEYLETTAKNVWALGDIAGKYQLKHSANLEARYVLNALFGRREKVNYWPMPHAIFTSPQIAAVGYTEEELKERKTNYAIGRCSYRSTGMGLALREKDGFVKILADRKTRRILGCHIIGPDASTLIHEATVAMKAGMTADELANVVHAHPALSEVVQRAAARVEW